MDKSKPSAEALFATMTAEERRRTIEFMEGQIKKRGIENPKVDAEKCVAEMSELWERFVTARAVFSYFRPADIGKVSRRSAPFYRAHGKDLTVTFPRPLNKDDITRYNDVAYWINQVYLVSLNGLLEYHHVVGSQIDLDKSLPGHKDADLLRRVRGVVAHTTGTFKPEKKEHTQLNQALESHYRPSNPDPKRFQLHIDEVLLPMLVGAKKYAQAKAASTK